jgi:hypothetical protein
LGWFISARPADFRDAGEAGGFWANGKLEADMKPSFLQNAFFLLVFFAAFSVSQSMAQSAPNPPDDLTGLKVTPTKDSPIQKILPTKDLPMPSPFPLDVSTGRVESLEFRGPEAMTAADRDLAASAQGEIERRASLQGLHFDGERGADGWGYEQAVCPAFPEHLILDYSRSDGGGDVTLFSAVVPRNGEGHVRVIPVRRRGYSLWTPASSNALTLNDFNHMVKEGGLSPDWLRLALCYSALAGGHVRANLVPEKPADEHYPLLAPASLRVSKKGGALVNVVDAADPGKRGRWQFQFAQSGRLLKVKRMGPSELVGVPTKEQPLH